LHSPGSIRSSPEAIREEPDKRIAMTNVKALRHDGYEKRLVALQEGVRTAWPAGLILQILERTVGPSQADQEIAATLQLFDDVHAAELVLKQKRLLLDAALPAAHTFTSALERGLGAWFGNGHPERARFGLSLGLRRPMSGETKAIAHSKSLATRKLRFTLGSRQRKALGPTEPTVLILGPDGKPLSAPK
jgi:hypothetical protein